jgi:hypothetical protein
LLILLFNFTPQCRKSPHSANGMNDIKEIYCYENKDRTP